MYDERFGVVLGTEWSGIIRLLFERLIWREHLGCQIESIMSCHVITRDELYDLCLQQWVGFGHLGSECPRIYRLVFIPSLSKSAAEQALETFTSSRWTEKAALIFNVPGQAGHCESNPPLPPNVRMRYYTLKVYSL